MIAVAEPEVAGRLGRQLRCQTVICQVGHMTPSANRPARRDLLIAGRAYTLVGLLVGRLMPVASASKWGPVGPKMEEKR